MADGTEISTPDVATVESTSESEPTNEVDTSNTELDTEGNAAETETEHEQEGTQEEKLYAGKYKSVEELEKGYGEAQKYVTKAQELQKMYDELVQRNEDEVCKAYEARQNEAKKRGFMTADEAEIADKVQAAEFEYYVQNLNKVNPEVCEQARQYLLAYYQTGHAQYLDEAKKLYSPAFIENVAQEKAKLQGQLRAEYNRKMAERTSQEEEKLAEVIKNDFKEFLGDVKENQGKATALKSFCDAGFIKSTEDMQAFSDIYGKIANYERDRAIKEYESQKAIEETKSKAQIEGSTKVLEGEGAIPSLEKISQMSREEYADAVEKYGLEKIMRAV
nr:MAG TPA: hypothetical protein [Caudoviricetes sp.]